jgi:hypothetical protein
MKPRIRPASLLIKIGIWTWGGVTVALALFVVTTLALAARYLGTDGKFISGAPPYVAGLYIALKDCGTVVGAVVGFSGLAWAHFFATKP